jgi:hypothetical protein
VSEYGVSDDDMPDCQPLDWGPEPYDDADLGVLLSDDEDLDAALSGETTGLPDALRPLAATLGALCAGPARDELDGEAAARAAFRRLSPPAAASGPVTPWRVPVPLLPVSRPVPAAPRILPAPAAARHRPRHRRHPPARRAALVLAGAAAAVAGLVVLAGAWPGSGSPLGHPGRSGGAAPAATAAGTGVRKPELEGGASAEPSPTPKVVASQPSATLTGGETLALCRQYLESSGGPGGRAAENGIAGQLSPVAGGPWNVRGFCFAVLDGEPGSDQEPGPGPAGYPGEPGYAVNHGAPGRGGRFGGPAPQDRTRSQPGLR